MKKIVNGNEVILSIEEEAVFVGESDENERPRTTQELDDAKTIEADIEVKFDSTLKAFALVVLNEINILRTSAGLPERTIAQLKNAVKSKL